MYEQKDSIHILGEYLEGDGSTKASVAYTCGRAEAHFFRNQHLLCNPVLSIGKRLQACFRSTSTVVVYNAGMWHITASILADLRTWEWKWLRRILRLRRRPDDSHFGYHKRTSKIIKRWIIQYGIMPVHGRVIKAVFKTAWKDRHFQLDSSEAPLQRAREYRSEAWWHTVNAMASPAKRRKLGITHHRPGQQQTSWEHPFVAVWGLDCRCRLESCQPEKERMRKFLDLRRRNLQTLASARIGSFLVLLSSVYKLPPTAADITPLLPKGKKRHWDVGYRRLWIQTDNKMLEAM